MSDKPFDPVTEGTPLDAVEAYYANPQLGFLHIITARDAAMLAKGEEIGRLKGLEEGRATSRYDVLVEIGQVCNAMKNATGAMIKLAIIAQIAKELATGKCRRAAAETAKEGE